MASRGKSAAKIDRRVASRETLSPIEISAFTSIDHMTILSRQGSIVQASTSGFLLQIDRNALVPKQFRSALSLQDLVGDQILLTIDPLKLEISGRIARTKRLTKDVFEIAIDFSEDAPEYWREILIDMLPRDADYE
jgi:hypothetical protein